jgi:hypothetical protein
MLHNLTYVDDMKECVTPESKRVLANLPNRGMVPVTTSASFSSPSSPSSSSPPGVREYIRAGAGFCYWVAFLGQFLAK